MNGHELATAAGGWGGAHALVLFAMALLLALATTAAIWQEARRRAHAVDGTARLRLACAVAATGVAVFAALAWQLDAGSGLTRFDLALSNAVLAQVPPAVVRAFALFTHVGDSITRTVLAVVVGLALLLLRHPLLALGFAGGLGVNGALTTLLKQLFGRTRPLQPPGGVTVDGYSFPSGHSAGSLMACGLLAYLALRLLPPRWHLPALGAAVAVTLGVGVSRIIIRAHFFSDVLAGYASGAAWLALCLWLLGRFGKQGHRTGR